MNGAELTEWETEFRLKGEMEMKDSTVRINDTLVFIQNTNLLSVHERQSAHQLATAFINSRFPALHAGQVAYENFSTGMSLGFHLRSDPNSYRNMKRAAYLLTHAIRDKFPGIVPMINPSQIADASAPIVFQDLLRKAAMVQDAATGSATAAQLAAAELYTHPLEFLRTNKLIVFGSPTRSTTQGDRNVLQFYFGYDGTEDRYRFHTGHAPGDHPMMVDSVVSQYWTTAGNWAAHVGAGGDFTQINAIELASQIMVTTQFTGCAFCMKRHGGSVYCAHVVPQRDAAMNAAPLLTGTQVAQRIANHNGAQGDFANAAGGGPLSIYGAGFAQHIIPNHGYPNGLGGTGTSYMTLIGVQRGTNHEIYSQVTQNRILISAERIF